MSSFKINVSDAAIENLHKKLDAATFPDELNASGQWAYGAPLKDVKRLAEAWKTFDWRKAEAKLNEIPQFMTRIQVEGYSALDIHYVFQPSPVKGAIPLLFCHGWPGSFLEVTKLLPLLTSGDGSSPAFHVVAPSLPNYGFSGVVREPGFNLEKYAEACHKLMLQLGFNEYVTQGGDWGFFITRAMGLLYPDHVKASHINLIRAFRPKWTQNPWQALQHAIRPYTEKEIQGFNRGRWFTAEGRGYNIEQSTKPQTIGYALTDSPVALLAWIYEKLHDWTDSYPWTDEEVLTWISIYQFSTAGAHASVRIYYEAQHSPGKLLRNRDSVTMWVPKVKLGLAYFPKELSVLPKTWGRTLGPVVYESENDSGGHFAAWEKPEMIARDLKAMFAKKGPCYGLVNGRTGYPTKAKL